MRVNIFIIKEFTMQNNQPDQKSSSHQNSEKITTDPTIKDPKQEAQSNINVPLWKFILPSLLGIFLFMLPIYYDDKWTLIVKIIADAISSLIGDQLPLLCVIIVTISGTLGLLSLSKPKYIYNYPLLKRTFATPVIWLIIRVLGTIFIWLTFINYSPEGSFISYFTNEECGGFVLKELLGVLVIIFAIAAFLLPLLLDFGLPEFIGALFTKIMRPVFTIPGRAAVDCLTSWIGDGTLGVMLTVNQYEQGFYSKREAAVIATTFSAVSITFSIVVLSQVNMLEYFGIYYLVICLVGIACALLLPRIPPLSFKKDEFLVKGKAIGEKLTEQYTSSMQYGIALAKKKIADHKGIKQFFEKMATAIPLALDGGRGC